MLPTKIEPRISSRESPNCYRATRQRFFNQKEFGSDVGYLSRSFRNSIIDDGIIKDLTFLNYVCNSLEARETKEDVYERDIQQQEEGKGLNRKTLEHLAISYVSISIVTGMIEKRP
ncbi:Uncharacterized protein Fot_14511 [Forsythia ovata]|uniref:Uncharacterized protein n=1 Tax=Forsythia ovata TaxID=205694 RepID=A0ABD1W6J0_9LAMI